MVTDVMIRIALEGCNDGNCLNTAQITQRMDNGITNRRRTGSQQQVTQRFQR